MRVVEPDGGARSRELSEGYLVCRVCRTAHPVLGGTAILALDVKAHLASHGNVYRRLSIPDPRLARFLLSHARDGDDVVPFEEVVARYADLLPADPTRPARAMSPRDARLEDALRDGASGPSLEIGCGVGRGTFVLAARTGDAVGVDRSVARVRRARNVQTTEEFRLPVEEGARTEAAIDLTRLARDAVDFVVAEPDALPFADGSFATVVVRDGDGEGPYPVDEAVRAEAARVAGRDGVVWVEGKGAREGEPAGFVRLVGGRAGGGTGVRTMDGLTRRA